MKLIAASFNYLRLHHPMVPELGPDTVCVPPLSYGALIRSGLFLHFPTVPELGPDPISFVHLPTVP